MKQTSFLKTIVVTLIALIASSCDEGDEGIEPKTTAITESIYSSITVQPDSLYEVFAAANGIVGKVYFEEGDLISKGEVLMKINNLQSEMMQENARLSVELARENLSGKAAVLKDLKDQIKVAGIKLTNDSLNFMRQQSLHEKGIGSEVDFENRKLSYESSRSNYEILKQQYHRSKKELEVALKQAENNYNSNSDRVEDHLVKSELNGKLYDLYKKEGELVNGQLPLALIGSENQFIIEMLVDEVDIVKLKIGQKVLISLDAYKKEVFTAEVTKIYPNKNERSQTFKIEGRFKDAPVVLYPGLSGEANIIVNKKEKALTIPLEYLMEGNMVNTADGKKEVQTGLKNLSEIEITDGLDTNTRIYLPTQ